jgi:hypothetical protein
LQRTFQVDETLAQGPMKAGKFLKSAVFLHVIFFYHKQTTKQRSPLRRPSPRLRLCRMHQWPILVISSGARDLAFSATCEEKISRLWLEMTIATQPLAGEGNRWGLEFLNESFRYRPLAATGGVFFPDANA